MEQGSQVVVHVEVLIALTDGYNVQRVLILIPVELQKVDQDISCGLFRVAKLLLMESLLTDSIDFVHVGQEIALRCDFDLGLFIQVHFDLQGLGLWSLELQVYHVLFTQHERE